LKWTLAHLLGNDSFLAIPEIGPGFMENQKPDTSCIATKHPKQKRRHTPAARMGSMDGRLCPRPINVDAVFDRPIAMGVPGIVI
jgi:hypothetical protein